MTTDSGKSQHWMLKLHIKEQKFALFSLYCLLTNFGELHHDNLLNAKKKNEPL